MIVTLNDFSNEATIPGLRPVIGNTSPVNEAVQNEIEGFIAKYEPDYLCQFFGSKEQADELEAYNNLPEESKTDDKKNSLLRSFKVTIAYFVAYYYFNDKTVANTGIGSVILQGENGKKTNSVSRCVSLWNAMVRMSLEAYSDYFGNPTFGCCNRKDIFIYINEWGI